jgi:hypothetical protein
MNDEFRQRLYNQLNMRETDDLVEIWQTNDREEWTELSFDVIREILQRRLGELPPQDEPALEDLTDDIEVDNDGGATQDELGEEEDEPVFYEPQDVLWLDTRLNQVALIAIIAMIGASSLTLLVTQRFFSSFFPNNEVWNLIAWVIVIVVYVFALTLESIIIYFPLKALGAILKILMEMEFNSRGVS